MPVVSRSAVFVLLRLLTLPAGVPRGGASVRVPYMFTYLCNGCSVRCGVIGFHGFWLGLHGLRQNLVRAGNLVFQSVASHLH